MRGLAMKWFRKKKAFEPADLEESTEYPANPDCGWYEIYTFQIENSIDPEELKWSLHEEERLALVLLDIGTYRNTALGEAELEHLRQILRFFAQYKKGVIFRPVYDTQGKGMEREPDHFEQVLQHLGQIGQTVAGEADSIFVWQGLLVGNWGEMHHSRYLMADKLRKMWSVLRESTQGRIRLAVRTPAQARMISTRQDFEQGEIPGIYDDGIFGSETHLGTFSGQPCQEWQKAWEKKEEIAFLDQISRRVPSGGEAVAGTSPELEEAVKELRNMHLTYLNCIHDPQMMERWKKQIWQDGIWKGRTGYDYIGAHLGYRPVIRNVCMKEKKNVDNSAEITIIVENKGFACCYASLVISLICENENGQRKKTAEWQVDTWESGEQKELRMDIEKKYGKYYLHCERQCDGQAVEFAHKNAGGHVYLGCLHRN